MKKLLKVNEKMLAERLAATSMDQVDREATLKIIKLYRWRLTPELLDTIITQCDALSQEEGLCFVTDIYEPVTNFIHSAIPNLYDEMKACASKHIRFLAKMDFELIVDVFLDHHKNHMYSYYRRENPLDVFLTLYKQLRKSGFPYATCADFLEVFKTIRLWDSSTLEQIIEGFKRIRGTGLEYEFDQKSLGFIDFCWLTSLDGLQHYLRKLIAYGTDRYSDGVISVEYKFSTHEMYARHFTVKDQDDNIVADFDQKYSWSGPYRVFRSYKLNAFHAGPWLKHIYDISVRPR